MASRNKGLKIRFEEYLREARPVSITPTELDAIRARLGSVSESYLRTLLRGSGLPLAPLVEGVDQSSFPELSRTLLALASEYEMGEPAIARRAVLRAKEHARFALRRLEGPAVQDKQEMLLWLSTWLENPTVFPAWLELRRKVRSY